MTRDFQISEIEGGYLADSRYITGIDSLSSYTQSSYTQLPTGNRVFRYTKNSGISWSDWIDISGLIGISTSKYDIMRFEVKYIGTGTLDSFSLIYTEGVLNYPVYKNTFLSNFYEINNPDTLEWTSNVLQKLAGSGITPKYIKRGEDFNTFWGAVSHFFASLLVYFRQFGDIENNEFLLRKFVESLGLYIGDNPSLAQLQYLFENYMSEFEKRGTVGITSEITGSVPVNGEAKRVIDYQEGDEYIFGMLEPENTGWCIGNSSPMYDYCTNCFNVIKGYENTRDLQDRNNYPISSDVDFYGGIIDPYGVENNVLGASNFLLVPKGFIPKIELEEYKPYLISVNTDWDYEITFFMKMINPNTKINFGVECYDSDKNILSDVISHFTTTSTKNKWFIETMPLNGAGSGWYFVRGIIKNISATPTADTQENLDIGIGNHLKFYSSDIDYIIPILSFEATDEVVYIYDFKVRPAKFGFTQGLIGVKNIIWSLYKNRSSQRTDSQVMDALSEDLIGYRNSLILKSL